MEQTSKEKRIINAFIQLIPNVTIHSARSGNIDEVEQAHYFIPPENKYLVDSEYFYKGRLNFIHFTNLFAIQSIISDKNLRLFNLHNLNDPREYSFAGNMITFNNENKVDAKDNFYLLSMCQTELLTSKITTEIEFNMWRLYGNNGYGVAIELSFDENQPINWKDYFLSKVHYGSASKTNLKELNKLLLKLESQKPNVSADLGQIVCFHKSRLFKLEQEIRLLFDNRKKKLISASTYSVNNEITSPILKTDISKSSLTDHEIKYLELPIYHANFKYVSEENAIPIPKIERIILGYQFKDNFKKVSNHLKDICEKQLGYLPIVQKSRLTKWYHDTP
jgi:hypothetical protein